MRFAHAPNSRSLPLPDWSLIPGTGAAPASPRRGTGQVLWQVTPSLGPEPPSLGQVPPSPRGRVLTLTGLLCGSFVAAGFLLSLQAPRVSAPLHTVTVALTELDESGGSAPLAPQPVAATPPAGPVEPPVPATSAVVASASLAPVVASILPSGTPAALSGLVGSATEGLAAGSAAGLVGGSAGRQGSAQPSAGPGLGAEGIAPPRFDAAYLQNPEPSYPLLSKRLGEEGRVLLRVFVNPEGQPEQVEIRQSSGFARLDQAALGTVRRWRFSPARRGSERLAAWVLIPLRFQLDA